MNFPWQQGDQDGDVAPPLQQRVPLAPPAPLLFAGQGAAPPQPPSPQPQAAPPPPAPVAPEQLDSAFQRAQQQANHGQDLFSALDLINQPLARFAHNEPTNWFAKQAEQAQAPVQQLVAARGEADKQQQRGALKASMDPESQVSKDASMLATAMGLIPHGQRITAAAWKDMVSGADVQAKREAAAANNKLAEAQFGYQQLADKSKRETELQLERMKIAATKDVEGMKLAGAVSPESLNRLNEIETAGPALRELQAKYQAARDNPLSAEARQSYELAKEPLIGTIAAGIHGKDNLREAEALKKNLPGWVPLVNNHKAGDEFFAGLQRQLSNTRSQTLRTSPALAARAQASAPSPQASSASQNPAGAVWVLSPKGDKHLIPANKLQAALANGGKLAP